MHRTLIIRREYLHFIPKYARYEKRHKNLAAHVSPAFRVEDGDQVTVGQCRPLSKTVRNLGTRLSKYGGRSADSLIFTGPIQRSPCTSPNWQGCQVFPEILSDFLYGILSCMGCGWRTEGCGHLGFDESWQGKIYLSISYSAYLNGSTKL